MKRKYTYENGIIYIRNLDKFDSQKLHNATMNFLKKVINERTKLKDGNTNKTRNLAKE